MAQGPPAPSIRTVPLRTPLCDDPDFAKNNGNLARTWIIFFEQLLAASSASSTPSSPSSPTGSDNCATWDLNNLGVSAPSVRVRIAGSAVHLRGWLVKAIASDLTVQIVRQSDSAVVGTITIPQATALETIVDVTSFTTSPFPLAVGDLLRPNITASDSSYDPAGVAVVTLGWA